MYVQWSMRSLVWHCVRDCVRTCLCVFTRICVTSDTGMAVVWHFHMYTIVSNGISDGSRIKIADMQDKWKTAVAAERKHFNTTCAFFPTFPSMSGLLCMCGTMYNVHVQCATHCLLWIRKRKILAKCTNQWVCFSSSSSVYHTHTLSLSFYVHMCVCLCAYHTSHFMYIVEIVITVCVCWLHSENSNLNEQSTLLSFHSVENYKLDVSVGFHLQYSSNFSFCIAN